VQNILSNKYVQLTARFILGIVFVLASIDKIAMPEVFAQNVEAYKLIPFSLVNIFALVLPWLELITGLFIISGVFIRASALLITSLLIIFILSMTFALLRGLKIDCGCFGSTHDTLISWKRVSEDIFLMILGIYIFFYDKLALSKRNSDGTNRSG